MSTAALPLPLRTDSVIAMADILHIVLVLIFLLAVTSAALWLYQRRFGKLPPGFSQRKPELEVVTRLRLSPRTQVFVLRRHVDGGAFCAGSTTGTTVHEFLVTESAAGATMLLIPPTAATPDARQAHALDAQDRTDVRPAP